MSRWIELRCHPQSQKAAVAAIEVNVGPVRANRLTLHYRIQGRVEEILFPTLAIPEQARADGLWRQTCFEAFIRPDGGSQYAEFNFAPSTQWAAYHFTDYRRGMSEAEVPKAPIIWRLSEEDVYVLGVEFSLPSFHSDNGNILNLSAVIEERDGTKSYWALSHPPEGPPDFHHPACFTLELPPAPAP